MSLIQEKSLQIGHDNFVPDFRNSPNLVLYHSTETTAVVDEASLSM
jgi:hypothetical protein